MATFSFSFISCFNDRASRARMRKLLSLLWFSLALPAAAATYYASPTGSGTTCSLSLPCALNTGTGKLVAGDTLYLRGGQYNVNYRVTVTKSGTASSYITVSGYPGETAIIDGGGTVPWGLVNADGAYVEYKNLTVQNSGGVGIMLYGNYSKLTNCIVKNSYGAGIRADDNTGGGKYQTIDGCEVFNNGLIAVPGGGNEGAYPSGIQTDHAQYVTIKNCIVYNNWGEGINPYNSTHATIQHCVAYDNLRMNYYLDNSSYGRIEASLGYVTPGNAFSGRAYSSQDNIFIFDENDEDWAPNTDLVIINNMMVGGDYGLHFGYTSISKPGSGIKNSIIANNTFVQNSNSRHAIYMDSGGTHSNSIFENNIIEQDGTAAIANIPSAITGITFDFNNWSKTPPTAARGPHDLLANPLLAKSTPLTPGNMTAGYFRLTADSPAVDHGIPISAVLDDFFGTPRPYGSSYDMGAHELAPSLPAPANLKVVP